MSAGKDYLNQKLLVLTACEMKEIRAIHESQERLRLVRAQLILVKEGLGTIDTQEKADLERIIADGNTPTEAEPEPDNPPTQ